MFVLMLGFVGKTAGIRILGRLGVRWRFLLTF